MIRAEVRLKSCDAAGARSTVNKNAGLVDGPGKYRDNVEAEVAGRESGQAMKLRHDLKERKA